MAVEFLFARHGESVVNQTRTISNRVSDIAPLTEQGRAQARDLLASIRNRRVIALYTSPLMRARETAEILAAGFGIGITGADGLREPFCGVIEGRNDAEAWKMHAEQEQAWQAGKRHYRIPEGESFDDLSRRFIPFIEQIVSKHKDATGCVVLVSHGSILRNMLPLVLSNIDSDFARAHSLSNCAFVTARLTGAGLCCTAWDGYPLETC